MREGYLPSGRAAQALGRGPASRRKKDNRLPRRIDRQYRRKAVFAKGKGGRSMAAVDSLAQ